MFRAIGTAGSLALVVALVRASAMTARTDTP